MLTGMTSANAHDTDGDANATVGQNVHLILWSRGINQRKFAAQLGISDSVLSKRLRGTSAWSAQDIADAAVILEVEPGRLFAQVTLPYIPPKLASSTDNPTPSKPLTPMLYAVRDTDLT